MTDTTQANPYTTFVVNVKENVRQMHGSLSEHQKRITKLEMELQAMNIKLHEQSMKSDRVEGGSPTSTATRIVDDDLDDNEGLCPREVSEFIEKMCPPDVRELIEEMFPELEDLLYFIWTDLEAERTRYNLTKERSSMLACIADAI